MNALTATITPILAGGFPTLSTKEYADRFNRGMHAFCRDAVAMAQRPLPSMKGLTRTEKSARLAQRLREDGQVWRRSATYFRKLSPPSTYKRTNRLCVALFEQMAMDQDRWADLVLARSPHASDFESGSTARMVAGVSRIVREIERAGGKDAARLERSLRDLQRSIEPGA